jgi:elongation of very long chain fatty acids protein 4
MISPIRAAATSLSHALDMPQFPQYVAQASEPFLPAYYAFESTLVAVAPGPVAVAREWAAENTLPAVAGLPIMDPVAIAFCLTCYYATLIGLFVLSKFVFGKLELRGFSAVHNLFLMILSLYMAVQGAISAIAENDHLVNNSLAPKTTPLVMVTYVFLLSKLPEFIDTMIMVLKQNYRQVSFLHLYHHSSILVTGYVILALAPGGDSYVSLVLNSTVHVFMYGYYFGTGYFAKDSMVRKALNSIKFVITKGQLTQFAINLVHAIYICFVVPDSERKYPRAAMFVMCFYMISMLVLFGHFLVTNQAAARAEKKKAAVAEKKVQ